MPWKVVNKLGKNGKNAKNITLEEAVHEIISYKESVDKERERREIECAEIERKHAEYYEAHMKSETERLHNWVDWYEVKLSEIREAPVDSRLRMLERLYRISEKNKNCGVTITSAGVINPVSYPEYPPELKILEHESLDCVCPDPCKIHEESPFCDIPLKPSPSGSKTYNWLGCFKGAVKSHRGLDEDADEYVKGAKAIVGDEGPLELERVRQAMGEIKCPKKLDISLFYRLNGRLPHKDLNDDDERILIHLYDTFCNESTKLLGKIVRCRTNVLYHLLDKMGHAPNADLFHFMKGGPSHQ